MLISADFLASQFIRGSELPKLLIAAEQDGVTILPVLLSPCGFKYTKLGGYQLVNRPPIPLTKMNKNQREETWSTIVETIMNPIES